MEEQRFTCHCLPFDGLAYIVGRDASFRQRHACSWAVPRWWGQRSKIRRNRLPIWLPQYHGLKGFPTAQTDNFNHTFVIIDGKLVSLVDLSVKSPEAKARMVQARGCADEHNW
jgi:hypothetical protein